MTDPLRPPTPAPRKPMPLAPSAKDAPPPKQRIHDAPHVARVQMGGEPAAPVVQPEPPEAPGAA